MLRCVVSDLVPVLNGVQGVAGSNPAVPTSVSAAEELTAAILVNPHDVDALAEAVHRGLNMPPKEQARRMRGLRKVGRNHTVHEWAGEFLGALEKSRP